MNYYFNIIYKFFSKIELFFFEIYTFVNMESFVERLQKILTDNDLSASQFAKKINVQRSSVSHILSKRNKPSLDFIIKISKNFKNISLDWLINGTEKEIKSNNPPPSLDYVNKKNYNNDVKTQHKNIIKIICFFNDNSFEIYEN